MPDYLRWSLFLAIEWWILLIPKHYHLFGFLTEPVHRLVYPAVRHVFGDLPFFADSSGMYVLTLAALLLGLFSGLIVRAFTRIRTCDPSVAIQVLLRYFLVLALWEYGWMKLTKMQFYLPEPNTVYTELGHLSKDIAYWSVIGSSPSYVIFLGVAELLAGLLLLFRHTRFAGLLFTAVIFTNVLMVNISFDISVKLFAAVLLLMTLGLLAGYPNRWRQLFGFPARGSREEAPGTSDAAWKSWLKAAVLALIVMEAVYPSVMTGNFYDDTAARPAFHGAYQVHDHPNLDKLFVHRRGYLIFENERAQRIDRKVLWQHNGNFELLDTRTHRASRISLKRSGKKIVAVWIEDGKSETLIMSRLKYRSLPLFDRSPHWFSDQYH